MTPIDNDKPIVKIDTVDVLPPCQGIPRPASTLKPIIGSCIGVLYECGETIIDPNSCIKCEGKVYSVHNGKLVKDTKNYILVNHYEIGNSGSPKEETRIFYKEDKLPHLLEYRVTPDLNTSASHYCADFRNPANTNIVPPDAVGILFQDPTSKFGVNIKNGRYLYWREKGGTAHCTLTLPDKRLYRVWYYHYPKPRCRTGGEKPILVAELTCKDNVNWIYKLSEKNLGYIAKC